MSLQKRNDLRREWLAISVQREDLLQIPKAYRPEEKINSLELRLIDIEKQIKNIEV